MQETDFYEQLLGLPELRVDQVERTPNRITLTCHLTTTDQASPHCRQLTQQVNQFTHRLIRDLDISGRQV